ncbi:C-C motif chemokine 25 [Ictalurus punctatus]|uniref:C-C motif chemokine 25 n=1 Tax=Ictalurus punctatus TaxID=7998 RepID=A0A2D0TAK0_ICTPU|nr:C-C motif chemokine 25 [Ictalurus punctatus]
MRFSVFFFLLFLSILYFSLAQGSYEDCCLSYVKEFKTSTKRKVDHYRRQEQDGGCNLPAIVFQLRRGRLICARPGEKWVQDLINEVDKRRKQNSSNRRNKHSKHRH